MVTTYTANSVNEYTAIGATTYGYDADGNMTSATTAGVTTTYTYNSMNELTGVSSPSGTYSYVYDPLGDPISTSFTSTATQTTTVTNNLYDGDGNLIGQIDGSGGLIAFYTYGNDALVSQVDPGGTAAYYDFDIDGSTVGITGTSGTYVNQYTYDPFGQTTTVTASLENPFTYVGQFGVTSDGSGLLQMGSRSYDPATGQFVSNDPAGLAGGDINLRTYVGNQPTDFIDPSGLKRQKKPSGGQSSGKKKPPPPLCVTCVLRQAAAGIGNTIGNAINGIGYAANTLGNGLQQWANDASNTLRTVLHGIGLGDPPAPPAPAAAERNASFPRNHQAPQLRPLAAERRRSSFQRTPTTSPAPPASAPPALSPPSRRSPTRSTSRTCRRPPRLRRPSPSHSSSVPT